MLPAIPLPNRLQRAVLRLAATRPASWLLSRTLARIDRLWLLLTGGRRTLTTALTGLPVVQLTTRGAVSGLPRVCSLIPIPDGDRLVVFATNFGSERHPAWYRNLQVNPDVTVSIDGAQASYRAHLAVEEDRDRYWRLAEALYPGYRAYRRRAGRRVPIVVLEKE